MSQRVLVDAPFHVKPEYIIDNSGVDANGKPKSQKQYMLVLYYKDGYESDMCTCELITGQRNVRDHIINSVDNIDLKASFVLVEDVGFGSTDKNGVPDGMPSVYAFMKMIEGNYNDGFSIDDYIEDLMQLSGTTEDEERQLMEMQNRYASGDVPETYQQRQINDTMVSKEQEAKPIPGNLLMEDM